MEPETRFRKRTRATEARQWQPGDLARAGEMVGWLMARGASFDHPSGTGETTTLAIGTAAGTMVAEPGWWVTLGEGAWWAYPPDVFDETYEPVPAPDPGTPDPGNPGMRLYECVACGGLFSTNCSPGDIECAHCAARQCSRCGHWEAPPYA